MDTPSKLRPWVNSVLMAVFVYYLASGVGLLFAPTQPFLWLGMDAPNYPWLVQLAGLLTSLFGFAFFVAAKDPLTFRNIIWIGFVAQILTPIFFAALIVQGALPIAAGWVFVLGDLTWAALLGAVLVELKRFG